jgi:outer membrane lipoprotein-sorting protein
MKFSRLVIFILIFLTAGMAKEDVDEIVKSVQKKYKSVHLIHADFKQINRFKLAEIENEVFGSIWISQDNQFRLETEDQVMVSNAKTFWKYNKLDNQVLIDYAQKSQQDIFLNNFLFKISDYYDPQILNETGSGNNKVFEIKLIPNNPEENFFNYIKVWLDNGSWLLKKVLYVDFNENEVEYDIEKIELNPQAPPNLFEFKIPEGAETVDLRF